MTTPNGQKYKEEASWPWPGQAWPWCSLRHVPHDPHIDNEGNTRCPGAVGLHLIAEE